MRTGPSSSRTGPRPRGTWCGAARRRGRSPTSAAPADDPDGVKPKRPDPVLPAELALGRLPPGRHGLPRSFVTQNQRLRMFAALLRVLPEHGYAATTIGHITGEAGVSRAAFYEHFESKEQCFLAAYDSIGEWFCGSVEAAVAEAADWRDRVRIGVAEALRLLAAKPLVAHMSAVEVPRAGLAARERQQAMLGRFAAALRDGHPGRADLPEDLADLLLGGVVSQIARYVDAGCTERLPEATRVMVEYLLIPYIGGEEARVVATLD